MFKSVLVPVDGSPFAEHALPWSLAAAGTTGTVHLVHIHTPPPPFIAEGVVLTDPGLDRTVREQEAGYMAELVARVQTAAPGTRVEARTIDTGDALSDALARAVGEVGADLVAMTTHGRGPFARFWLGSTSDELQRRSPVPVLLIHGVQERPAGFGPPPLTCVVVPVDGSDLAEKAVEPAVRFARPFGAELSLVLVLDAVDDPDALARIRQADLPDSVNPTSPTERAGIYLDRVARTVAGQHVAAQTLLVREGSPAEVVLELAKNDPKVGVAIATHGRSGLTRLLMGSVTDEIIRGAAGPVLVYHPPG